MLFLSLAHYSMTYLRAIVNKYEYGLFAGDKGDKWLVTKISIPKQSNDWNVIVKATVGNGVSGDMAIDDVSLGTGLCSGSQPTKGVGIGGYLYFCSIMKACNPSVIILASQNNCFCFL